MAGRSMGIFCGPPTLVLRLLLLLILLHLECTQVSAFNLDVESVLQKNGEPGSLFGFSMVMHWQLAPTDKRMLLVGAPKAKALSGQQSKVTGGLYNCDFASSAKTCERVNFDDDENVKEESKENQWMGVTVHSQGPGGKVLTCAHRYQRRANVGTALESRDITGRCYVLGQDLTLNPHTEEENGNWRFCEGRQRGHERFGSCQQGLSAVFDKDYHYLIFGAPGVVRLEQKNESRLLAGFYNDGPFEVGDESKMDVSLVPVLDSSYLGFSLDSGMQLVTKGTLTVVAGAPRAHQTGSVVLLKKGHEDSKVMLKEFILRGEGLASSFGYDLAVVDLNKDGWQDIVVGAPQYFEKDGVIGGAAYVYINKAGDWNSVKPIRIDGPQNSMFGLAVENLGDINQDLYHDFAVGAPYDEEGTGRVYIFHGSDQGIGSKKPSQVLEGMPLKAKLFGYSLAGNMDLDKNNYPDLAVGSLSDSVFVFRARPVVEIKKEITITPKQLDLTNKNCGETVCLKVHACFSYSASAASYNPGLEVEYSLDVEAKRKMNGLPSRVVIEGPSATDKNNYKASGTMRLTKQNEKKCLDYTLTMLENIRDKLQGISIDVSAKIMEGKRKRRQASVAELQPVLDANKPTVIQSESNLVVKHRYCSKEPNKDVFLPLLVKGDGVPVVSLSNQKEVALEVTVTNIKGEDAYEARVQINLPNTLSFSASRNVKGAVQQASCTANKNGSLVECELGNPFKQDSKLEIDLQLQTTSNQTEMEHIKAKARVEFELLLSLSGQAQPSQVFFTGVAKGESAMKTESDIGSLINYNLRIINLGKPLSKLETASLKISWPKETKNEKWLLYLMDISSTGVDKINCSPGKEINPLSIKKEPTSNRKRRAIGDQSGPEGSIARLLDKRKHDTLACDSGAKCVELHCPLQGLDSNADIMIHARLWNSTLIEEFSDLNYLEIMVKVLLVVDVAAQNTVIKNSEIQMKVTVFPEKHLSKYGAGPSWWIILVAILLGLLLLALLIFLLWKCGFFRKDDSPETEKLTGDV
ncbi:hypothetical protein NHX12_034282 [Muraenolepis orangiensis]|uniref:Integrin alpha-2 domain-containing protein n=1 Tax=Muraenolepis orangiensis TaxID=630683 RepID=A0A9Q0HZU8_9TELE|nr:hypothetical protein NHX12_034282 [Muraenolepis orangiensis]